MVSSEPTVLLSHFKRADGSATFTLNGFKVLGVVNGPLEVSRRDENPEEAVIDVTVRPAVGSGGTRERHLESILQSTLRQMILVHDFPRTLIQVTLQIMNIQKNDDIGSKAARAGSNLIILPPLLQTATMALISASIPLSLTITSTCLAISSINNSRTIVRDPTMYQELTSESVHALAFTSYGDLLLAESEGVFNFSDWDEVYNVGKQICCSVEKGGQEGNVMDIIKSSLQSQIALNLRWKQ